MKGYFVRKDIDKRDYARCVCSNQQSYIVRDTSQNLRQSHKIVCWLGLLLLLSTKWFVEYDWKKEATQLSFHSCEALKQSTIHFARVAQYKRGMILGTRGATPYG